MAYVAASNCVKVRLKTRIQSGQSVVVSKLWPETDLSVVNAVTNGGIYIDGNTIGFNPDTQNLVSSGGMTDWVGSHYCPLEKTIPGGTQYADMFVRGGTATVTPVPGNVGYGTLDNSWNISTHIPAPPFDEHTSRSLPTVPAVASAIDEAIYGMTTGISGAYVKKTDSATTASHGIVVVPADHGLSINGGTLSMNVAQVVGNYTDAETLVTAGNAGGVVVMNAITGATTGQEGLAVAPTVDAVYDAISSTRHWVSVNFMSTNYVPPTPTYEYAGYGTYGIVSIERYGGIVVNNGVITVDTATYTQIGGVVIKANGGILVDGGTVSIEAAPVYANVTAATAGTAYGGVRVIKELSVPTDADITSAYVPNNNAVFNAVYGYTADFYITKSSTTYTVHPGTVYVPGTSISQTFSTNIGSITQSGAVSVWLNLRYNDTNVSSSRGFTATVSTTKSARSDTYSILLAQWDADGIPHYYHKGPVAFPIEFIKSLNGREFEIWYTSTDDYATNTGLQINKAAGTIYDANNNVLLNVNATHAGNSPWTASCDVYLSVMRLVNSYAARLDGGTVSNSLYHVKLASVTITGTSNVAVAVNQSVYGPITLPASTLPASGQFAVNWYASANSTTSLLKYSVEAGDVFETEGDTTPLFSLARTTNIADTYGTPAVAATGIYLHIKQSGSAGAYTYAGKISNTDTDTQYTYKHIQLAAVNGQTITQLVTGPIYLEQAPAPSGGGTEYFGDFKVECAGVGSPVTVATGDVYIDGNTNAQVTAGTVTCNITGDTVAQTLWLNIPNTYSGLTASTTPTMSNTVYSVPLAYVIGSTVCQYQYGPVVIRGRWA